MKAKAFMLNVVVVAAGVVWAASGSGAPAKTSHVTAPAATIPTRDTLMSACPTRQLPYTDVRSCVHDRPRGTVGKQQHHTEVCACPWMRWSTSTSWPGTGPFWML